MKRTLLCVALTGLACLLAGPLQVAAAEDDAPAKEQGVLKEDDVLRVIERLQKAGLKVTDDEDAAALAADEVEFRSLMAKLEGPSISVEYKDQPLQAVLGNLQEITGVNLLLDPRAAEAPGDDERQGEPHGRRVTLMLKDVKPISVLRHVLRLQDLIAIYADEALVITLAPARPHSHLCR